MKTPLALLVACAVLLNGCGWHLRGHTDKNNNYPRTIYFTSQDPYAAISRQFNKELQRKNITVDLSVHQPRIELQNEFINTKTASLNPLLDPAEQQIIYQLSYLLNGNLQSIQLRQTFLKDNNRAAARDNEKNIAIDELRQQAIQTIIEQMLLQASNP